MIMNSAAVFLVFACLLTVHVEGQAKPSVRRCLCQVHMMEKVRLQRIDKIEVYPPSASCEKSEILVVLKNRADKICLNPESNFVKKNIMKVIEKRNKIQKNSSH
ncbi:C-X-C motif chemokine 11-6-like [Clarias gariepinus]|uniref:C-X-C motif chemokine 11-6-like n=1 Tax=Clarias gariepinus TaxID=13013 RepID=UPI00234D3706|nr:C-X-C motif chemokine 11-6-like [Clarias gariepinus]